MKNRNHTEFKYDRFNGNNHHRQTGYNKHYHKKQWVQNNYSHDLYAYEPFHVQNQMVKRTNDNYNNYNNYYLPMDYNSYQYGQIDQTPLIQPNISNGYQSSLMANDPPNNNNGRFIYY